MKVGYFLCSTAQKFLLFSNSYFPAFGVRKIHGSFANEPAYFTVLNTKQHTMNFNVQVCQDVISELKIPEIRAELKCRGLKAKGKKDDMLSDLKSALYAEKFQEVLDGVVSEVGGDESSSTPEKLTCLQRKSSRAGKTTPETRKTGPNGRYLCRWCSQESNLKPKGNRKGTTFCSRGCLHEHMIRTSSNYVRKCLLIRDEGVCQICGFDAQGLYRKAYRAIHDYKPEGKVEKSEFKSGREAALQSVLAGTPYEKIKVKLSRRWSIKNGQFWDADHIVPVIKGGGLKGLSNFRTLCKPCHQQATAELKQQMAKDKKSSKVKSRTVKSEKKGRGKEQEEAQIAEKKRKIL
mmetsp:Transcript_2410/g.3403  ORF Transcript_2410/g.3403 Transcript_2410/m.3403 type:complete len:348 (-) Transcript_2410:23-1066(-)